MPSQWIENNRIEGILGDILPGREELEKMTCKEISEKYGPQITAAAKKHDVNLNDDDLNAIIDKACGVEDWPEFHHSHYDLHS